VVSRNDCLMRRTESDTKTCVLKLSGSCMRSPLQSSGN
jgi:hypothetical protein